MSHLQSATSAPRKPSRKAALANALEQAEREARAAEKAAAERIAKAQRKAANKAAREKLCAHFNKGPLCVDLADAWAEETGADATARADYLYDLLGMTAKTLTHALALKHATEKLDYEPCARMPAIIAAHVRIARHHEDIFQSAAERLENHPQVVKMAEIIERVPYGSRWEFCLRFAPALPDRRMTFSAVPILLAQELYLATI